MVDCEYFMLGLLRKHILYISYLKTNACMGISGFSFKHYIFIISNILYCNDVLIYYIECDIMWLFLYYLIKSTSLCNLIIWFITTTVWYPKGSTIYYIIQRTIMGFI